MSLTHYPHTSPVSAKKQKPGCNLGFRGRNPEGGMCDDCDQTRGRVVSHLQNITILSPESGSTLSNWSGSRSRSLCTHSVTL